MMPCFGELVQIRGDWAEFTATFGLPNWAAKYFPCFFVFADVGYHVHRTVPPCVGDE